MDSGRGSGTGGTAYLRNVFGGLRPYLNCPNVEDDDIPVPTAYWRSKGRKPNTPLPDNPCKWVSDTVAYILERREYLGHTINFKTYKQSYKSKKKLWNPEEKQIVFENTHEAIIAVDVWEKVQALRKNKRRPTRTGKTNLFSGVAYCADCGEKLYLLHQ